MQVKQIQLKNFRCFSDVTFDIDAPCILFQGANGSGKTSILEALHYLCYVRSFRTYFPQEIFSFEQDNFFIKAKYQTNINDEIIENQIQAGVTNKKKLIKINQKPIASYKELMDHYRVVTLVEDDLLLIKGPPDIRRTFIDQAISLSDPTFLQKLKSFRQILQNKNALLQKEKINHEMYHLWNQNLWDESVYIQNKRIELLKLIEKQVGHLISKYFDNQFSIFFNYRLQKTKKGQSYNQFIEENPFIIEQEQRFRRSLFGAHLDDFIISFNDKKSKQFASRGQQKLIVFLLKSAQLENLKLQKGCAIFLLDDFMTDFDPNKIKILFNMLSNFDGQYILTTPANDGLVKEMVVKNNSLIISLD